MSTNKTGSRFVPATPAGTDLWYLARSTEEAAWKALLKDAAHMPYKGKAGFQRRGYTVNEFNAGGTT